MLVKKIVNQYVKVKKICLPADSNIARRRDYRGRIMNGTGISSPVSRLEVSVIKRAIRTLVTSPISLFVLAHFAHHLLTALPVPLLPFIRDDFSLDYVQAGLVISAFGLAYGIGQLPAGWLADRFGPRVLLTIGICGVAVAGLLVGLSQSFMMLIVFLVVMGIAGGGYHPAASPLISSSVLPENQGRSLGIHVIGGSGSFFLAPLIAAAVASTWGWRGSFIGLSIPVALIGVTLYILLRRRARGGPPSSLTQESESAALIKGQWRRLAAFMALAVITQGVTYAALAFVPLYLVDGFGVAEGTAAAFLSIAYSAGLWASPLGGWLSDRLGRVRLVLVVSLLSAPLIYTLSIVSSEVALGALLFPIGVMMYLRMPAFESFIIRNTPERRRSTVLGVYHFASMESGAVLAPLLGTLIERAGFSSGFIVAGAAIAVATLACALPLLRGKD